MAEFDMHRLKAALLPASRLAFADLRRRHQGESFYCMGLFTCGEFAYFVPTAMTEEGLDRAVLRYQSLPQYANEPVESLRHSLRWSPCDSPLQLEANEYFENLNNSEVMGDIVETLRSIDFHDGWKEFDDFVGRVHDSICEVLKALDEEGAFGVAQEREKVFVSLLMGDQDDSILEIGRRLNPPETVRRFLDEWRP